MLDYYPLGSLREVIQRVKETPLFYGETLTWINKDGSCGVLLKLILDVCEGLHYMHSFNPCISHLDLKPENILIDSKFDALPAQWSARISDFGVSAKSTMSKRGYVVGTPGYVAPEVLGGDIGPAADVYALATTILDIASDNFPVDRLAMGDRQKLAPSLSLGGDLAWLGNIVVECWNPNAGARPSVGEVKERLQNSCAALRE